MLDVKRLIYQRCRVPVLIDHSHLPVDQRVEDSAPRSEHLDFSLVVNYRANALRDNVPARFEDVFSYAAWDRAIDDLARSALRGPLEFLADSLLEKARLMADSATGLEVSALQVTVYRRLGDDRVVEIVSDWSA